MAEKLQSTKRMTTMQLIPQLGYMEDKDDIRARTTKIFCDHGYEVQELETIKQAKEFAKCTQNQRQEALFVLDVDHGHGYRYKGLRVAREIKQIYSNAIVVILSSHIKTMSPGAYKKSKADFYVEKTLDINVDVQKVLIAFREGLHDKKHLETTIRDGAFAQLAHYTHNPYPAENQPIRGVPDIYDVQFKKLIKELRGSNLESDASKETKAFLTETLSLEENKTIQFFDRELIDFHTLCNQYGLVIETSVEKQISDIADYFDDPTVDAEEFEPLMATQVLRVKVTKPKQMDTESAMAFFECASRSFVTVPLLKPWFKIDPTKLGSGCLHRKSGLVRSFGAVTDTRAGKAVIRIGFLDLLDPGSTYDQVFDTQEELMFEIDSYIFAVFL